MAFAQTSVLQIPLLSVRERWWRFSHSLSNHVVRLWLASAISRAIARPVLESGNVMNGDSERMALLSTGSIDNLVAFPNIQGVRYLNDYRLNCLFGLLQHDHWLGTLLSHPVISRGTALELLQR